MEKLQLTGRNLGRVFNSGGYLYHAHLQCYWAELPYLKLKTKPKQLLDYLLLYILLLGIADFFLTMEGPVYYIDIYDLT
jgi:hypothetical protein